MYWTALVDMSRNPRRLWVPFTVWLVIAVVLMGMFQNELQKLDEQQVHHAHSINTSGRQRMISQRVALIAERLNHEEESHGNLRLQVRDLLGELENADRLLREGSEEMGIHSPREDVLNFMQSDEFSIPVANYIAQAYSSLEGNSDPADLMDAAHGVLALYEEVTQRHQMAAVDTDDAKRRLILAAQIIGFAMLGLLALFSVIPSQRVVNRTLRAREQDLVRLERQRAELVKGKSELSMEVAAKEESETQLERLLDRTRVFNLALEKIYATYVREDRCSIRLIEEVTEQLCSTLQIERASVWLFSPARDLIICEDLFEIGPNKHSAKQCLEQSSYPAYFEALNSNRIIDVVNAFTDPRTIEFSESYLRPLGVCSMLDAPILAADEIRGVICCETIGQQRAWTVDEIGLVTSAAQFVGMSLAADEHQQLAEDLEVALHKAEVASASKSAFLASMSHEIRTPMNGVLGMTELMLISELPEEVRENVEIIQESGKTLLEILNDILDISKIEAGKVEFELVEVNIQTLIGSVFAMHEEQVRSDGLSLKENLSGDWISPNLMIDPTRVRQVLVNLISNARKFTHKGGIEITVSQSRLKSEKIQTRIEVMDTGIGLSEDQLDRIFQVFHQADQSTTREYGGTGLGLAISKQLVERMGGRIGVKLERGKGSTFWFTLVSDGVQLVDKVCEDTVEELETWDQDVEINHRLLVAEDNPMNQRIVSKYLSTLGFEFDLVENGQQALEAVVARNYDAVLMDINMPVLDGVEATRLIRELPGETGKLPIIALTANAMKGDQETYLAAGMDDYISKPINPAQLVNVITTCINQTGAVETETSSSSESKSA